MNSRASRLVPYLLAFFSSVCIMTLELVASRLVARHVGASLSVWTSVIGIMLGGICLGSFLGGRLADRIDPTRALGPLFALGAALTLGILVMNAAVGYLPGRTLLPLSVDTIIVVSLNFLVPGTVLGMIGPIVAKLAVQRAVRSGGALGDVYFWGAVGSIAGTFLAGFVLMYLAPTSTIVMLVAAGLLFVGLVLVKDGDLSGGRITAANLSLAIAIGLVGLAINGYRLVYNDASEEARQFQYYANVVYLVALGFLGASFVSAAIAAVLRYDSRAIAAIASVTLLGLGSVEAMGGRITAPGISLAGTKVNLLAIGGALIAFGLAVDAISRLRFATAESRSLEAGEKQANPLPDPPAVNLRDLSVLAFIASFAFMMLEMIAGRLVTRNLGSSIYGWTSVIGVLLGGLSLGNWLGGRIANRSTDISRVATLFVIASVCVAGVILAETPRPWMVRNPIGYLFKNEPGLLIATGEPLVGSKPQPFLSMVNQMVGWPWAVRILWWVSVVFFLPSVAMGTFGPVLAKLAVDRVRSRTKGTGAAIGQVYAWGMVGSILGTFLAGFFLIDIFGTKGLILVLATALAVTATVLGTIWHAGWAGIPMGLCVIAFLPPVITISNVSVTRNVVGVGLIVAAIAVAAMIALKKSWRSAAKLTPAFVGLALILVSLLFLDLLTKSSARVWTIQKRPWKIASRVVHPQEWVNNGRQFLMQHARTWGLREDDYNTDIVEDGIAYLDESSYYYIKISNEPLDDGSRKRTLVLDNLIHGYFIEDQPERLDYDYEHIYALVTGRVMDTKARDAGAGKVEDQPLSTLFLGGGSYTFPRYLQHMYPKTTADVAEIDPAVTEANFRALFLPRDTTIKTIWGDARQYVDAQKGKARYDLIFGDAFNDFSVPWHLTTREFNERINGLLSDDGVYMINIIDKYLADEKALFVALEKAEEALVEKALAEAGATDAKKLSNRIVVALDEKKLGVNTTVFKRKALDVVAGIKTITDARRLEAIILPAYQTAKPAMRGTRDELIAEVRAVLEQDKTGKQFPSLIPALAAAAVDADIRFNSDLSLPAKAAARGVFEAREFGSFLGSWVETAKQTFGEQNVYVFGTAAKPGDGQRETFVVVASRKPLDLSELGIRAAEPQFFDRSNELVAPVVYGKTDMEAVKLRSRGITLTDDYAPVENLLAPVARTRADDD